MLYLLVRLPAHVRMAAAMNVGACGGAAGAQPSENVCLVIPVSSGVSPQLGRCSVPHRIRDEIPHAADRVNGCLMKGLYVRPEASSSLMRSASATSGITLERLTLYTPNQDIRICQELDLTVQSGQSLLIVGPSGCGKSSLLRAISGVHAPSCLCPRQPSTLPAAAQR